MPIYHSNGVKLSTKDKRDYKISRYAVKSIALPNSFELWVPPVNDQKTTGNCVAQSLRVMKAVVEYNATGTFKDYSVGWTYGLRTALDNKDAGMMPRRALANAQKYGMVFKSLFESNDEVPAIIEKVKEAAIDLAPKALPERISEYFALTTAEEVKKTIYQMRSPVMCVVEVFPNFYTPVRGFISPPDPSKMKGSGYHAITIYGWNERGWLIQNSWGTGWGNGGRAVLSYNYPIIELWGISDFITNKMVFRYKVGDNKAYINGRAVDLKTLPVVKNGELLIDIKTLEKLGASVHFNSAKQEVTAVWTVEDFEKYANEIYVN